MSLYDNADPLPLFTFLLRTVLFANPDYSQDDEKDYYNAIMFNKAKTAVVFVDNTPFDEDSTVHTLFYVTRTIATEKAVPKAIISGDYYHNQVGVRIESFLLGVDFALKGFGLVDYAVDKETIVEIEGSIYPVINQDGTLYIYE